MGEHKLLLAWGEGTVIEAVLAVVIALLVWREREVWRQLPGVALIGVGIAILLLG